MGLETSPIVIPDLNPAWPLGSDPISQGDDHIRNIKGVLDYQLSGLGNSAVTATADQINAIANRQTGRGGIYTDSSDSHVHTLSGGNWVTVTPTNVGAVLPGGFNVSASPATGTITLQASTALAVAYVNYQASFRVLNASPASGHYQFRWRVVRSDNNYVNGSKAVEEVNMADDPYIFKSAASISFDANPPQTQTYRLQINLANGATAQATIEGMTFWVSYSSTP